MRNILLTLSYDGTDFCGWQRQDFADKGKSVRTVQGEIEKVLEKIHKCPVALTGIGLTDSGVHAHAQAANFFSPVDSIPVKSFIPAMNSLLPHDIRINDAREVDEEFSSRFSATSRTYRYFIDTSLSPFANEMRYVWPVYRKPDIDVLNSMCSCLKGETDCSTFAAAGDMSQSKFRYIDDAHFYYEDERTLVFEITANAFLWKMVRSLTGTLIAFEKKGADKKYFEDALKSCDRKKAGPTAPPEGLFLWEVKFDGIRRHV